MVLGLDSAELTGFAVVELEGGREVLKRYGTVHARSAAEVSAAVADLVVGPLDVVAVEEAFIHPKQPHAGLALSRLLGRWLQELETRGLATVTVPASMWQTAILPGVTYRSKSAERKRAAVRFAGERFGVVATEDEADAIAMACWVVRNATRRAA